jgi:GntR family transcriptional repressor for pyruvate dehydrogenase complex
MPIDNTGNSTPSLFLEPIERMTATEAVAQRLIDLVGSRALKPGDRLPPERELAAQLQVGRTTVREALKLLTLSGLLEARRGSGTYVREDYSSFLASQMEWPALLGAREVDQIIEVREPLEMQAARLAAQRATPEEIEQIAVFRELLEIEGRDIERETDIDLEFHHAIARASHNALLVRLMLSLQTLLRQYIALSNEMTDDMRTTVQEHEAVYAAIKARDPEASARAMADHLRSSRAWILGAALNNKKNRSLSER